MSRTDFLLIHRYIQTSALSTLKFFLLQKRIKPNHYDPYHTPPQPLLFAAIRSRNIDVLDYFLAHTDLAKLLDEDGVSGVGVAVAEGDAKVVEKVLAHHTAAAVASHADKNGLTPLLLACRMGLWNVVERLIEIGAVIDQPDAKGSTPLHYAASFGHCDIAALLILKGADFYTINQKGWSPSDYAYSSAAQEYIKACHLSYANGGSIPKFLTNHSSIYMSSTRSMTGAELPLNFSALKVLNGRVDGGSRVGDNT